MSINKAHAAGGGVVLFYGERLLIFYDGCEVQLKFDNQPQLSTTSKGSVFLTSHRTICLCKSGQVKSMSMPLLNMKQVEVKQPVFGANRIEGKATPEPDGGFTGMAHFSVTFNKGGAGTGGASGGGSSAAPPSGMHPRMFRRANQKLIAGYPSDSPVSTTDEDWEAEDINYPRNTDRLDGSETSAGPEEWSGALARSAHQQTQQQLQQLQQLALVFLLPGSLLAVGLLANLLTSCLFPVPSGSTAPAYDTWADPLNQQ